jgi:alkylated DNA repair dioxygenase AlkB
VKPNHQGPPEWPEGFSYREGFLSEIEEQELLERFEGLEFRAFDFHGYIAKRRIIEYGFEYDFSSRRATVTQTIPEFLEPFKKRAAEWAALARDDLVEAVITEYTEGSPIGWHRDVPKFETILGISLNSSCRMRFKPYKGAGRIVSIMLEPRSAYLLLGAARWNYQHSIPAVQALRYSITFRTLSKKRELS